MSDDGKVALKAASVVRHVRTLHVVVYRDQIRNCHATWYWLDNPFILKQSKHKYFAKSTNNGISVTVLLA